MIVKCRTRNVYDGAAALYVLDVMNITKLIRGFR